jgi:hypothetical protein
MSRSLLGGCRERTAFQAEETEQQKACGGNKQCSLGRENKEKGVMGRLAEQRPAP